MDAVSDRIADALDAITREFGSTFADLQGDADLRRFLARQLVLRGVTWHGIPLEAAPAPDEAVLFVHVTVRDAQTILGLDAEGRLWQGTWAHLPLAGSGQYSWEELARPAARPPFPPAPPIPAPDPMGSRGPIDPRRDPRAPGGGT